MTLLKYMKCTKSKYIKAARLSHRCSWCGQPIDIGQPYIRWRYFGDEPTTCKVHPECHEVIMEDAYEWGNEEWTLYDHPRGLSD